MKRVQHIQQYSLEHTYIHNQMPCNKDINQVHFPTFYRFILFERSVGFCARYINICWYMRRVGRHRVTYIYIFLLSCCGMDSSIFKRYSTICAISNSFSTQAQFCTPPTTRATRGRQRSINSSNSKSLATSASAAATTHHNYI